MPNKAQLPSEASVRTITSLVGTKTISNAYAYKAASVTIVELAFSDSTYAFIKFGPSGLEVGGTNDMGTGTKVNW